MVDHDDAFHAALTRLRRDRTYGAYAAAANALDANSGVESLTTLRIAVVRNFTIEPLLPVLRGELALCGLCAKVTLGGYDTMLQDCLDPASPLFTSVPQVVVVAAWLPALSPRLADRFPGLSEPEVDRECTRIVQLITSMLEGIRQRSQAPILLNNFPLPAHPAHGLADAQSASMHLHTIMGLNRKLLGLRQEFEGLYLVDYLGVAARVGANNACNARSWELARAPIGPRVVGDFGRHYAALIRAVTGKTRKVLVLDCDNSLWGGVIGEDTMAGITLGQSHPGSSFLAFQRALLNLHDRGIILALASKNNEADVLEVLQNHPEMLLREQHLAGWRINWDDKASNLRSLAEELRLGLDAFVFADDSEFECNLVREALPEVEVIHLKGDPAGFADRLHAGNLFDTLIRSPEDLRRTAMYRAERERSQIRARTTSLADYLASLDLVAEIGRATQLSLARTAQLTQKTNQFNLTTKRYTEADITRFMESSQARVLTLRLRDRIDDLGIIGVAIVCVEDENALIDTFLLSCRALGRGAEQALLAHVCHVARSLGATSVTGTYGPTARNAQVADFYTRHGFLECDNNRWTRSLVQTPELTPPAWIKIQHLDSDAPHVTR